MISRSVVGVISRIPLISSEFSGCLGQFAGNSWNVSYYLFNYCTRPSGEEPIRSISRVEAP